MIVEYVIRIEKKDSCEIDCRMLFYVEFQNTEKKKKSRTVGNNA